MKEKMAKKILIKSNWINDYYYIVKVMHSCANTDSNLNPMLRPLSLHKAFWWGDKQLKDKKKNLITIHPFLANQIEDFCKEYRNSLWIEMTKVEDKIGILLSEEIENNSEKEN